MALSTTMVLRFVGAQVERGLARVQSSFRSLGGVVDGVGKSLLSPFAALTAMLGAGALTAGLMSFVKGSSAAAASIEDLTIQLEVLTGSFDTAKTLIKQFAEEEKKSALNMEDYASAAKTILAFGGSVEEIMPTLRMLGDISMGNSDRFGSLALAFSQTTAAGRLMGQEVLQFVNAGFNPLEQISRDTGKSMKDLKKQMEDGAITVGMVKTAFINATSEGGRFYKAIDKGSASTSAKINQLDAAMTQLKVALGTGFNDGLKVALDAASTRLPQLQAKFAEFGKAIGKTIQDAVNGDLTRLYMLGTMMGDAIFGGLKIALFDAWQGLGNWMNSPTNWVTGETDKEKERQQESDRQYLRESMGNELIDRIKTQYKGVMELPAALPQKSGPVPNQPQYRYANRNEPATIMDGERVVRVLDRIEKHLAPQP